MAQRNYQASGYAYHASLTGDGDPSWTKVWSYIQLGKILDIIGERERAKDRYRSAIQTGDNTGDAMARARELLEHPFRQPTTH